MFGFKDTWDFFIILLVFYNAIFIPIDMVFSPPITSSRAVFDAIIDYLFIIDLAFCFVSG